ncbi:MAG: hypothetical protein AAGA56_18535, partial [Myxococcota bacterium]
EDAVQHVALLVGYRDGYGARTATRARLGKALGLEAWEAKATPTVDDHLHFIAEGAAVIGRELQALAAAPPPEAPPPAHPQKPGPIRTAARAESHLGALVGRLELIMTHYLPRH